MGAVLGLLLRALGGERVGIGRHIAVRGSGHGAAVRAAWSTLVSSRKRSSGATRHESFRAMSERMRPAAFWKAAATSS